MFKNMEIKNKDLIKFVILFLGITIPVLFNMHIYETHDGFFHLRRFTDIYLSIKNGYFATFISQDLLNGLGYPTLGFYPYLLIVPFVLPMFLGFSNYFCYSLYHIFISSFTMFTSYLFIKEVSNKKEHHYIFILTMLINPMRLYDIYISSALGRYSSMAILPLVFLGLYKIYKNKKHGVYILSLSMTLMAYTHIVSTLIVTIFIFIMCLFSIKTIMKNSEIILKIILAGIISVFASSFVIFPILEQLQLELICNSSNFLVNNYLLKFKYFNPFIFIILILLSIIFYKHKKCIQTKLVLILIWFIIMQTNAFPWEYIGILKYIQFTFRILMLTGIFLGLYIIAVSKHLQKTKKILEILTLFLILICTTYTFTYKYEKPDGIGDFNQNPTYYEQNIGLFDYLPVDYKKYPTDNTFKSVYESFNPEKIIELNKDIDIKIINSNTYKIINNQLDYIIIPKIFYYGYEVKINNKISEITQGNYGFIQVNTENIKEGIIEVNYIGTPIQHATKYISFVFLLFYCFYPLLNKKLDKVY